MYTIILAVVHQWWCVGVVGGGMFANFFQTQNEKLS